MKKKIITMMAVAASMLTCATPAFAANTGSAHTDFSLYVANDPVYTITVPETVSLNPTEHTQVAITASDVKYIADDKKISVKISKGSGVRGRLYLQGSEGDEMNGNKPYMMTLMVKGTSGEFKMGALEKQIKGLELASFTEDGTMNYEIYPCSQDYPDGTGNLAIQKGVHYTGYMDYSVQYVDR